MFCPQCKVEYRQGFTRCADCDVDLAYELGATTSGAEVDKSNRVVWRGVDQQECVSICYQLQDVGIPYKVNELPGSLGLKMTVTKRYELAVRADDYERAKSVLDIEDDPPETFSESDWQKIVELQEPEDVEEPEAPEQLATPLQDELSADDLPDTPARRDAYFRDWYPEDATGQVWSQEGPDDWSCAIEMALRENLIHCRVDSNGGNGKVIFVMPEDEARAGEIVREILESSPPE